MAARPTEVRLVAELLEAEHEDVQALAKDVIQQLDASRADRDYYQVNITMGGQRFAMGPFNTETAALNAVVKMVGKDRCTKEDAARYVGRMVHPAILDEPEIKPHLGSYCPNCEHPMVAHAWPKAKRPGCMVGYDPDRPDKGCPCRL